MNKRIFIAIYVVMFLFALNQIRQTYVVSTSTGIVSIHSVSSANISLDENNYQGQVIGKGNAKVRLEPGNYTISATSGNKIAKTVLTVKAKQTLSVNLVPNQASVDPFTLVPESTQKEANSLIKLLPFIGPGFQYSINYKFIGTENSRFVLTITSPSQQGLTFAETWVQEQGYSLSNLGIDYINAQVPY